MVILQNLNVKIILRVNFRNKNSVVINFKEKHVNINKFKIPFVMDSNKDKLVRDIKVDNNDYDYLRGKQISDVKENVSDIASKIELEEFINIFYEYKTIFSYVPGKIKDYRCKFKIDQSKKFNRKRYRIPFAKIGAARNEVNKSIKNNIIELGDSEYTSNLVAVSKPGTPMRLGGFVDCRIGEQSYWLIKMA